MKNSIVNDCLWKNNCECGGKNLCDDYTPADENTYLERLLEKLRENNVPTNERRLSRKYIRDMYVVYDDIYTSDESYVRFINDVLKQIRNGYVDYVYYEYQLEELLRFEPDMQVEIQDGIFYVSLPLG